LFKVPNRLLTLILLACGERASSVFALGGGDPLRAAFATAFLNEFARAPPRLNLLFIITAIGTASCMRYDKTSTE
jgi:hypothetical protein